MTCENCVYYWFNEDYRRNMCNYYDSTGYGVPPCEDDYYEDEPGMEYYAEDCDDEYYGEDSIEMGFNPYIGGYDYDC